VRTKHVDPDEPTDPDGRSTLRVPSVTRARPVRAARRRRGVPTFGSRRTLPTAGPIATVFEAVPALLLALALSHRGHGLPVSLLASMSMLFATHVISASVRQRLHRLRARLALDYARATSQYR
jgi:hypothetical protein